MSEIPARPLFQVFPALAGRVPFVALADLPTPLEPLARLSARAGAELWIKRDGLSHPLYGGNKMRKFEFVFGDVLRRGAQVVITGGGLGSHHTLATAVIARRFGLQAVCAYYCQPIDEEVRRNLRRSAALGIDAHLGGDYVGLALSFAGQYVRWLARTGRRPYFIYPGASGTLGVLGYINAAFELQAQWQATGRPAPEAIYVAAGSCGTLAGLLLGARLAGLEGRVVGVRVVGRDVANRRKVARLANRAAGYLRHQDPTVPKVEVRPEEVELLDGYLGPGYAHPTSAARQAVAWAAETEELPLETTYTGKALAALLDHARRRPGARLVFVDTFAQAPALEEGDYQDLPPAFWPLFDAGHPARCWCLRGRRDPGFWWRSGR
ncbi:MAG: pyridoxal-phosphate dependent enzyme [Anaerolineae bacterium]|jgi:D-cysteine desulfhydrase